MRKTRPLRQYRITLTDLFYGPTATAVQVVSARSFGHAVRLARREWPVALRSDPETGGWKNATGELVNGCNVVTVPKPTKLKSRKIPTSKWARRKGMAA